MTFFAPPLLPERLTAPQLLAASLPPRVTILDPILTRKSLTMLYGPRGLGKTHVALGIAYAAASGGSFLKWQAHRPHRVLYVDGEMAAIDLQERLRQLGAAPPTLDFFIADLNPGMALPDLGNFEGQKLLWEAWGTHPPELLVLDNLSSLVGFTRNDPDRWTQVQRWLMGMRRIGIAVLVIHHANKEGDQRGTSRREDVLDVVMALRRPADYAPSQGARFELHFEKARGLFGQNADPIEATMTTDSAGVRQWDWRPAQRNQIERFVALLKDGVGAREAGRELGLARTTAFRLKRQAIERGLVV